MTGNVMLQNNYLSQHLSENRRRFSNKCSRELFNNWPEYFETMTNIRLFIQLIK